MKNISDKSCIETRRTHFVFNNFVYFLENPAVFEITWKNAVELGRPQMIIWRMHIACWILKATKTHKGCAIPIDFPLQQSLRDSTRLLGYTYIACLVRYKHVSNSVKLSDTLTEASPGLCTHSNEHSCNTKMLFLIPATDLKCIRIYRCHAKSSAETSL
jgi:hypothetical protein